MKISIASFFFSFLFCFLNAQTVGDFMLSFPATDTLLGGDSIKIHVHVPSSYTGASPFKLILGVHGLGDPETPEEIRDYLSPAGDSIEAIVICPTPYLGDQLRSEIVVNDALDSVLNWFNIDPNEMYISGYSAGSDVAAQYVFTSPKYSMKGLVWFAPGFFSTPDLSNQEEVPPVCLCWGDQDFVSLLQASSLNNTFSASTIPYLYNVIPSIGHTMNFPQFTDEFLECIHFIDNAIVNGSPKGQGEIEQLVIYPNPASNYLKFNIKLTSPVPIRIKMLDLLGNEIWNEDIAPGNLLHERSLNVKQIPNGIYLLNIENDTHTKFLIEH